MAKSFLFLYFLLSLVVKSITDESESVVLRHMSTIIEDAKMLAERRLDREMLIAREMIDVVDSSPFRLVYNFFKSQPYAKMLSRSAVTLLTAMRLIRLKFGLTTEETAQILHRTGSSSMLLPLKGMYKPDSNFPIAPDIDYCPYPVQLRCNTSSEMRWVRTVDGSCNNLNHHILGRSMTPFRRLLPAKYSDGIEQFRHSVKNIPLPGARFLSFNLFRDFNKPSLHTTMMFVFFGQFTDHDLTRTAATLVPDLNKGRLMEIKCGVDGCVHNIEGLEACAPIPIAVDDADFAVYNRCLKFVRNLEVPNLNCEPGPREQLNQVTHWLDGSQIYGSSNNELQLLRNFSQPHRGGMAIVLHPHRLKPLLPREVIATEPSMCRNVNATVHCFQAGDPRVNENAGLGTLHTIFVRYHNVIEAELYKMNKHWLGERLFQETRRIVTAVLQHITYNEWLPLLLGPRLIEKFDLELLTQGYYKGYDVNLDGRVPNEFATAAFRLGHTLLQERLRRASGQYETDESLLLSETFNHPEHMFNVKMGGIDAFIRGLSYEPSQSYDHFFTKQITRSLFTDTPPYGPGHDLLSLNIQRGRDHGLSVYNAYRDYCGLRHALSFEDFSAEIMDAEHLRTLSILYRDINDIDLFVGGVSEQPVENGIAGPTFACIIARTFHNLRRADRLWYENKHASFNTRQLQEIRKITMAKVLCINGDEIYLIQPYAFLQPGKKPIFYKNVPDQSFNLPTPCKNIPDINLYAWKDEQADIVTLNR